MNHPDEHDERRIAPAQIFRDIALELLEATALDLSRTLPDPDDRCDRARVVRQDREDALRWMSGGAACMSFAMCCDALNVDADAVRRQLAADPETFYRRLRDGRQEHEGEFALAEIQGDTPEDAGGGRIPSRSGSPRAANKARQA